MKESRICKWCGKPFIATNGRQFYCKDIHYASCVVCGKSFELKNSDLGSSERRKTCSRKCTAQLRKQTVESTYGSTEEFQKQVHTKMKATNLARYGTESPQSLPKIQEKAKNTNLLRYGKSHHMQTEQSKESHRKLYKDAEFRENARTKYEATMKTKYGDDWRAQLIAKSKKTYEKEHGYSQPILDPSVRAKIIATMEDRYGTAVPGKNEEVRSKISKTQKDLYGKGMPLHDSLIEKREATCLAKYGVQNVFCNGGTRDAILRSYEQKTGYSHPMRNPETRDKVASSLSQYYKLEDNLKNCIGNKEKAHEWATFKASPEDYLRSLNTKPTLNELSQLLGVSETSISPVIHKHTLEQYVTYGSNKNTVPEKFIIAMLHSIDSNINIIQNDRKLIYPYEIDIFLPEYRIGIEVNPTATHNHNINIYSDEEGLPIHYHQMKTDLCESKGIFLFHVFGYDMLKPDILKSMLQNLLHKNKKIIYARNCTVHPIDNTLCCNFLEENHRQGKALSGIRYGLYYNEELLSVMTFGKMRSTIGTGKEDLSDCWELVRFCSKLDTTVVGGASKLFTYFIRNHNPSRIRSFSDRAHTKGSLYAKLGFKEIRRSDPNYMWVNLQNEKAYHRINAQKQNIKSFLKDDNIDLSSTEKEIMVAHGFVQVFDSGTILWEWQNQ